MTEIKTDFPELIQDKNWNLIRSSLDELDSFQIAQEFEELSEGDETILFMLLDRKQAKEVFQNLPHQHSLHKALDIEQ